MLNVNVAKRQSQTTTIQILSRNYTVVERTFAMIKPDAVAARNAGKIIDLIESNGFTIVGMEKTKLSKDKAGIFYAVHKERPFYSELVDFVSSGPVVLLALEKEGAIAAWRDLMGATDPLKAAPGTIRKLFGTHVGANATHGSDAPETAQQELALFFPNL
ncbi:MAG: nucleoside-diphosphate kinase [Epsilonproteobacteria bacterium]|nr:nucleoside-diphosphate kinase [Campylobacterota bacterium]